jgi:uncharacterized phage protein (TIGR02220 family)
MNYWFSVSNDIVDDPKLGLISTRLGIAKPFVTTSWIYILREASRAEKRGVIDRLNADEAEYINGIPATDFVNIAKALAERGLITYEETAETLSGIEFYNVIPVKFGKWQKIVEDDLRLQRDRERNRVKVQAFRDRESQKETESNEEPLQAVTVTECNQEAVTDKDSAKEAKEVLTYLNQVARKNFQPDKSQMKFILARLKDGYTVADLKGVIDRMAKDKFFLANWVYMRPETLFNPTKFQTYINTSNSPPPKGGAIRTGFNPQSGLYDEEET